MGFRPERQGPLRPAEGCPPRAPGSLRRTTHVDHVRSQGEKGRATINAAARDLFTPNDPTAAAVELDRVEVTASAHATANHLESLAATPADDRLDALVGERLGGGFRARLAEVMPDQLAGLTLLHLLLDDLPGANLVSGYALQLHNSERSIEFEVTEERMEWMVGICAGWDREASLMVGVREDQHLPTPIGPAAPALGRRDDPLAWHEMPDVLALHGMRRRRRLDLIPLPDGTARFDVHFRDSHFGPYGTYGDRVAPEEADPSRITEGVLHEYLVTGALRPDGDAAAGWTITELSTDARVLPWQECVGAVASTGQVVGTSLAELRARVRAELTGTGTCTHLNDLFRSLADLEGMAAHLVD